MYSISVAGTVNNDGNVVTANPLILTAYPPQTSDRRHPQHHVPEPVHRWALLGLAIASRVVAASAFQANHIARITP